MIPVVNIAPGIPDPLPEGWMPTADEISDEGFGNFRDTWSLGQVPMAEAAEILADEERIMAWLDEVARTGQEFELLAATVESNEITDLPEKLRSRAVRAGLEAIMSASDDWAPLNGLEIGVAGLACSLSAIGCPTAASCRFHVSERSWSDCPVVFFAATGWRLKILAELILNAGCGLGADRGMLTIYAPSIREMHRLGESIQREKGRFRKRVDQATVRQVRSEASVKGQQLSFEWPVS